MRACAKILADKKKKEKVFITLQYIAYYTADHNDCHWSKLTG